MKDVRFEIRDTWRPEDKHESDSLDAARWGNTEVNVALAAEDSLDIILPRLRDVRLVAHRTKLYVGALASAQHMEAVAQLDVELPLRTQLQRPKQERATSGTSIHVASFPSRKLEGDRSMAMIASADDLASILRNLRMGDLPLLVCLVLEQLHVRTREVLSGSRFRTEAAVHISSYLGNDTLARAHYTVAMDAERRSRGHISRENCTVRMYTSASKSRIIDCRFFRRI
eukprot:1367741-Amorphochlora_amoeboformis.AAC.3